jgi:hypothetical protein
VSRWRCGKAALAALLLMTLLALFLLAFGPGDGPLVFVEETPLKLSLDKAKKKSVPGM